MGKNKLKKFAENKTFDHVIEPSLEGLISTDFMLKGQWHQQVFGNTNPIVLELGCGKGEYTVQLAEKYKDRNFIGIDIKGARIWRGAKNVQDKGLKNVRFLRTRIEFLDRLFDTDEINEIWLTFPDPQPKNRKIKKRLTSTRFLNIYQRVLQHGGVVHLKTDSLILHRYTLTVLEENKQRIVHKTNDLYNSVFYKDELRIKTHYESLFLEGNPTITYICFQLDKDSELIEPEFDEE